MSKSAAQRERYETLKANRQCTDCKVALTPDRGVRCLGCWLKARQSTRRWRGKNEEYFLARTRHRAASLYWSNPEVLRAALGERRLSKKVRGLCYECPAPALDDNVRCAVCRDKSNARRRVGKAGKVSSIEERREIAEYRPLDEQSGLTRVRVLRGMRRLDWIAPNDFAESIGCVDATERNTVSAMMRRLVGTGLLERRDVQGPAGIRGLGSLYDYRITAAGCAEFDAIARGASTVRHHQRAA
jgi:hypothetical protein